MPAPGNGHIASCALPGCSDVQVYGVSVSNPLDVIAVGASRWWLGTGTSGGNATLRTSAGPIGGDQLVPSRMVANGDHIYWSAVDGLRSFAFATGILSDLLPAPTSGSTRIGGVALDSAGRLYVTQQSNVLECTIAGGKCTFTKVATTPGTAIDVAVDATHVYWGTSDGSVWRLKKP